jgi:hypothetical protein
MIIAPPQNPSPKSLRTIVDKGLYSQKARKRPMCKGSTFYLSGEPIRQRTDQLAASRRLYDNLTRERLFPCLGDTVGAAYRTSSHLITACWHLPPSKSAGAQNCYRCAAVCPDPRRRNLV